MPVAYLIGDSICAGYTPWVRKASDGRLEVRAVPENAFDSRNVLRHALRWLGDEHYDVIHVNCGLHDLKLYDDEPSHRVPLEEYRRHLTDIVAILRPHADTVLWASTTPVQGTQRKDCFTRSAADVKAYNAAANQIMVSLGVPVNDLHSVVQDIGLSQCIAPDQVHMTTAGYRALGERVAAEIVSAASPGGQRRQRARLLGYSPP